MITIREAKRIALDWVEAEVDTIPITSGTPSQQSPKRNYTELHAQGFMAAISWKLEGQRCVLHPAAA